MGRRAAKVMVIRVGTRVERAFAGFAQHVWRCQACTGGLCLFALEPSRLQLCPQGRWWFLRARRLWNPTTDPITIRRRGRAWFFAAWKSDQRGSAGRGRDERGSRAAGAARAGARSGGR